jgi:hypothetical protein
VQDISPALLAIAAEMRASGISWEKIGKRVGRHPDTCRHWPDRFPATWHRLFRAAEERHVAAGGSEGLAVLRVMLREGSERSRLCAAQTLYRGRLALRSNEDAPVPSKEEHIEMAMPQIEQTLNDRAEKDDEERACQAEEQIQAISETWRKRQDPDAALAARALAELVEKPDEDEEEPDGNASAPAADGVPERQPGG